MKNSVFDTALSLFIGNPRERRIYEELLGNNESRPTSTRFGKKAIRMAIVGMITAGFSVLFSVFVVLLQNSLDNQSLAVGFQLIGLILCIALAAILALYSLLIPLTRLRYARWQRTLNDNPIGKRATIFMTVGIFVDLALCVLAAALIILSFS